MARYRFRSIWPKFCGSRFVQTLFVCARAAAIRLDATTSDAIAPAAIRGAENSRVDEGSPVLEVLGPDRFGRPVGERRDRAGRIVESIVIRFYFGFIRAAATGAGAGGIHGAERLI
jgi:hypothetical protein